LFFFGWIGVTFVISRISGWSVLKDAYGFSNPFSGDLWRFQSASMRWAIGYNNCLTIGSNREGLYISAFFFFRPFHLPLFIPWEDVSVNSKKMLLFKFIDVGSMEFNFQKVPTVPFRISRRLSLKIAQSAGPSWPGQTAPC